MAVLNSTTTKIATIHHLIMGDTADCRQGFEGLTREEYEQGEDKEEEKWFQQSENQPRNRQGGDKHEQGPTS